MDFDLIAMKQRAKGLMKMTSPTTTIIGMIYTIFVAGSLGLFVGGIVFESSGANVLWILILLIKIIDINLKMAVQWHCLKITRESNSSIGEFFSSLAICPIKITLQGVIREILIAIGSMMCLIGAVLPIYLFRFSGYALRDDEALGVMGSLKKSMKLSKGHFGELIKLDVSNIGWYLLVLCTCGLANVYVKPYMTLVYAEYYDYLKAQEELFGC